MITSLNDTLPRRWRPTLLAEMDRRFKPARLLLAAVEAITADLGGEANLTWAQRQLIQHAAFLGLMAEAWQVEALRVEAAGGTPPDPGRYVLLVNTLTGVLKTIGVERRARTVDPLDYARSRDAAE